MDTSNPKVQDFPLSSLESFLLFLFNPNIALILGAIAFYGLVTEFTNPGVILPGVAGGIALILSLYSMAALDVNAAGAALLILALILFVTDVYATAHGVLTAGGVICFVAGSLMLFNNSYTGVPVSLSLVITLALVTAGFSLAILGAAIRQRRKPAGSGPEKLIGSTAVARTSFEKEGKVFADGALWKAMNIGEHPINEGEEVIIMQREGLKLLVRLKGQSDNRMSSS
jgi:membrane-bound serine protease (ClpP class)